MYLLSLIRTCLTLVVERVARLIDRLFSSSRKGDSYKQWMLRAKASDDSKAIRMWVYKDQSSNYDYKYIKHLQEQMLAARSSLDYETLIHTIRSHSFRNVGNILNPKLYSHAKTQTKDLIECYLKELDACLQAIALAPEVCAQRKLEFLLETRHAVGRTALILSGGGKMGLYHIGVLKVLWECNLLPRIISGSSSGSIMASYICSKSDSELSDVFDTSLIDFKSFSKVRKSITIWHRMVRLVKEGFIKDINVMGEFLRDNLDDITFQEAYDKTGRILNITVTGYKTHEQDRLLNYLTSPNVVIWSAVCASCSVPFIFGPFDLLCKDHRGNIVKYVEGQRFVDGSIGGDVPVAKLAEFFNVNCLIVSQVNPQVLPFLNHSEYLEDHRFLKRALQCLQWIRDLVLFEVKFRIQWLGKVGLLPAVVKKYANIVAQEYAGHINIWPAPKFYEYLTLLSNPTKEDVDYYLEQGAQRTFIRNDGINQIRAHTAFERSLETAYQQIKRGALSTRTFGCYERQDTLPRTYSFIIPRSGSREEFDELSDQLTAHSATFQ